MSSTHTCSAAGMYLTLALFSYCSAQACLPVLVVVNSGENVAEHYEYKCLMFRFLKVCSLSVDMTFSESVNPKSQRSPGWKDRAEAGYYCLKEQASPH